jgi:glycosyltransferase involved in cell wall biosynthesis
MSFDPSLYPPISEASGRAPRPFWSVIVPAYKPQYLTQALRSVLDQDPGPADMEIIVIDDCSPHPLEPIVRQVGGERITYVRQKANLGTYPTQNAGLAMSRGLWMHILNDDDWVLPGFYGTFQAALRSQPESVGAACCLYATTTADGQPTWTPPLLRMTPGVIQDFVQIVGTRNPIHPVATVVRRSVHERLGGYYPGLKYAADWELNKRIAVHYDWWYEPRVLACYREHEQSCTHESVLSADQIREFGRAIEMSHAYLPEYCRDQITAAARDYFAVYALHRAELFFAAGDAAAAIRQLQEGLRLSTSTVIVDRLVSLFGQPEALPIRRLLPQLMMMLQPQAAR